MRAVILLAVRRVIEPAAVGLTSLLAVGAAVWLDLVTTPAERAFAATEPATATALPGARARGRLGGGPGCPAR